MSRNRNKKAAIPEMPGPREGVDPFAIRIEPLRAEPEPACGACKFWVTTDPNVGECRRYPPITRFPVMGAAMWCGEFQVKPIEAKTE